MKKKMTLLVVSLVAACFAASVAMAAPYATNGNFRNGKTAFGTSCATCHKQGGKAKALNPSSKTMKDWDACFTNIKKKHKGAIDKVSDATMTDIFSYFNYNAADGQAMKGCG